MRAMILAAGRGERLRPLTDATPKPLLKVEGQPLIVHHLHSLVKAGISEVVINLWHLGEQIKATLGDGQRYGLNIQYSIEQNLQNTGGGIVQALPLLGPDPFIVLSADILTDFALGSLSSSPTGLAHLVMVDNPDYHPAGDFSLQHGKVGLTSEQTYTYANIGVYRPEFFTHAPHGPFSLGTLLREHIANGVINGQYYNGLWHNIGTVADLEFVNSI